MRFAKDAPAWKESKRALLSRIMTVGYHSRLSAKWTHQSHGLPWQAVLLPLKGAGNFSFNFGQLSWANLETFDDQIVQIYVPFPRDHQW